MNSEKSGGAVRRLAQMQAFREAMTDCALIDMGALGSPFTWADHQTKERLDRSLWNEGLRDLFPRSSTTHLHPSTSDHSPLKVEICTTPTPHRRRRRLFRFDQVWAAHPECDTVVTRSWESEASGDLINQTTKKIKQTSAALTAWQKPTFVFRQAEMCAVRNKLNELLAAPFDPAQNEEKKSLEYQASRTVDSRGNNMDSEIKVLVVESREQYVSVEISWAA